LNQDDDDDENQPQVQREMEIDSNLGGVDERKTLAMLCINARGPRITPEVEVEENDKESDEEDVESMARPMRLVVKQMWQTRWSVAHGQS
jgi:hypothetical protein